MVYKYKKKDKKPVDAHGLTKKQIVDIADRIIELFPTLKSQKKDIVYKLIDMQVQTLEEAIEEKSDVHIYEKAVVNGHTYYFDKYNIVLNETTDFVGIKRKDKFYIFAENEIDKTKREFVIL